MKWLIFSVVLVIHASADKLTFRDLRDVKSLGSRIVGGLEAIPHSFPYQAAIFITSVDDKHFFCGGSLCSLQHVLTAAHCLFSANDTIVLLGAHNITMREPTVQSFASSTFFIHSGFNMTTVQNDIALIQLPRRVEINAFIQIIPLQRRHSFLYGEETTVSGWGLESTNSTDISPVLKHVSLRIIPNIICSITYNSIVTMKQICQSAKGAKSTCSGDSGGPVVIFNGKKPLQVGIVSYGHKHGCEVGKSVVQTKVSSYYYWILHTMKNGFLRHST